MNPQVPNQYSQQPDPQQEVNNPLSVMQSGEQVICEVKRHPIGILGIYIATGFLIVFLAFLAFVLVPSVVHDNRNQAVAIGSLVFIVVALLCLVFTFISNVVYWGNRWVVTSDSITQITQTSLFDKQSSQLSLGNLEDVTAEQDGILPHMFGYGSIRVETAGERSKFTLTFCPNPSVYAKQILNARELFEQRRRGEGLQRPYRAEGAYAPPEPSQQGPNPQA